MLEPISFDYTLQLNQLRAFLRVIQLSPTTLPHLMIEFKSPIGLIELFWWAILDSSLSARDALRRVEVVFTLSDEEDGVEETSLQGLKTMLPLLKEKLRDQLSYLVQFV